MTERLYLRGEGGAVFPFDPPLCPYIEARFDAGLLVRVNADGSAWAEDADVPRPRRGRPPGSKNKPKPELDQETAV